ncbi:Guanosine-diphosphatase [Nowakowskiella sp. JEL0407]|nr:Guanosine-diphosphatase [Nowakowskiella sp. JEL0407]
MIDAGSTGSRIHVYRFNFCNGPLPTLEDEAFHQLTPGLSSYESDPEAAARSLDPLLEVSLRNVPREMYGCTPIAVKATAGLRLLGKKKSEEILATVERRIKGYPFRLVETDGVVVMEGRDEGVFAWITVNYLLGTILKLERVPTAGIMDLGGGSTQIVFEPDTNLDFEIAEGDHKYILTFGGRQYTLFQHSYLRYGLMESRQRVKQNIVNTSQLSNKGSVCHDVDFKAVAKDNKNQAVELMGLGANFKRCHDLITSALFQKDAVCLKHPCSFDGVYQPPLTETFRHHDIYIFSYFYDRAEPLGLIDAIEKESENEAPRFPVGAIRDAAKVICKDTETEEEFISEAIQKTLQGLGKEKIMKLLKKNPDYCLDLTYMYALLSSGYSIPDERDVRLAKKIKGVETGWCLGAAIHVVDEMFQEEGKVEAVCRIQEIS